MAADTVSVHLIFFIVATSLAAGVAVVLGTSLTGFAHGVAERTAHLETALGTDVTVVNDPARVAVNPTILYVKNVGSRPVEPATLTVLVDGRFVNFTWAAMSGALPWAPGDVVRLTVPTSEVTVTPGDHTVRTTTATGATDVFRFRAT